MKCHLCRDRPAGFNGHLALAPVMGAPPPDGTAFACTLCGSIWTRRHVGEGRFTWEPEELTRRGDA